MPGKRTPSSSSRSIRSRAATSARVSRAPKWVYLLREGSAKMRDLLGGKGANLAEMAVLGLPVPPGFIITTRACNAYLADGGFPDAMWRQVVKALVKVEEEAGRKLGDARNPLLLSCRSGARFSMPGMMDTVLNIGLNDEVAAGLIALTRDPRFVYDSHRRLVQMFGTVVQRLPDEPFQQVLARYRARRQVNNDADLAAEDLCAITADLETGRPSRRAGVVRAEPGDPSGVGRPARCRRGVEQPGPVGLRAGRLSRRAGAP